MKKGLVSIFVPYYNDEKYISECIKSILNQTYKNFELILFNHASTDSSREIAHSFDDDRIVHIDSDINYGAGSGLNLWNILSSVQGEYIKVFCADDIMYTDHLMELIKCIQKNPEKDFVVSTKVDYIDSKGKQLSEKYDLFKQYKFDQTIPLEWQLIDYYFRSFSLLPWGGGIVKTNALKDVKKDNSMIFLFDMSFWVELLINNKKIACVNKSLIGYRKHSNMLMASNNKTIFKGSVFEHLPYLELFYGINNMELMKYICRNVPAHFINQLQANDNLLSEFVLSLEMFYMKTNQNFLINFVYEMCAYRHMYKMFQDDVVRKKIQRVFNFTIKDFRDLYKNSTIIDFYLKDCDPKKLSTLRLVYLLLRKLYRLIFLRCILKK